MVGVLAAGRRPRQMPKGHTAGQKQVAAQMQGPGNDSMLLLPLNAAEASLQRKFIFLDIFAVESDLEV